MPKPSLAGKLVVAISSRALFDLTESHRIYTVDGVEAYHRYQVEHEEERLSPGPAFVLARLLVWPFTTSHIFQFCPLPTNWYA